MTRRTAVNVGLLAAIVALFALPLALRLGVRDTPGGQAYGGTDRAAQTTVESVDPGYHPWFRSLFNPSSPEVESGLFALQAAAGAGALGFVLGRLSGRRSAAAAGTLQARSASPDDGAGEPG